MARVKITQSNSQAIMRSKKLRDIFNFFTAHFVFAFFLFSTVFQALPTSEAHATGNPITYVKTYNYDKNSNVTKRTTPNGDAISYEYDALKRLTKKCVNPTGTSCASSVDYRVDYTYDANGNRLSMADSHGTTTYTYDRFNRPISIGFPGINPIKYKYDNAGNLTKITYPTGEGITYVYDNDKRLTSVTDSTGITSYQYNDSTNTLTKQTLPNGVYTDYTYDSAKRVTGVVNKKSGGTLISSYHYVYDANSNITRVDEVTASGSKYIIYTYDALNRLTNAAYSDGTYETYTYDASGNRLTKTTQNGTINYEYDMDNRLLQAGNTIFFYDNSGNLTRKVSPDNTENYTYDAENRLIGYTDGANTVTFAYDGDGNRISKTVNGNETKYINEITSPVPQVLIETNSNNSVTNRYAYGHSRINQINQQNTSFYTYDRPGRSVTATVNASQAVLNTYEYDSFGNINSATVTTGNSYKYTGEQYDEETGLINLRNRYYDPETGRFISKDLFPGFVQEPQSKNPYPYVESNPVNFVDPSGLARRGHRPLEGWPFSVIGMDGSIIDVINLEPTHEQFWFDDGQRPSNIGFHSNEIFYEPDSMRADYTMDSEYFDDSRLREAYLNTPPGSYNWLHNNCQDWAANVLITYSNQSYDNTNDFTNAFLNDVLDPSNNMIFGPEAQSLNDLGFNANELIFRDFYTPNYGGVSLSRTATLLSEANIGDITGSFYDDSTGQVIMYGLSQSGTTLPKMKLDDLAVAVRSVYGYGGVATQDPGVSIGTEASTVPGQMKVRYDGQTYNTEFGQVMFTADRLLKTLSLGKDNITGNPVSSSVSGYKNMLTRYREVGGIPSGATSDRMWFVPKEVSLIQSADDGSIIFDKVEMELLTESKYNGAVVDNPQAEAFASHFTTNYNAFATEFPELKELKRLGEITAVVKWIRDGNIPFDLSYFENYQPAPVTTPDYTPQTSVSTTWREGRVCPWSYLPNYPCTTHTISITGGVKYKLDTNNFVSSVDIAANDARAAALDARPAENAANPENHFSWTFQPEIGGPAYTATAHSLSRSQKDGSVTRTVADMNFPVKGDNPLALVRTYSSFNDKSSGFGFGWDMVTSKLRFPAEKKSFVFTFNDTNVVAPAYYEIYVTDNGKEHLFELIGLDDHNLPVYEWADGQHYLKEVPDGGFSLKKKNNGEVNFDVYGKVTRVTDRNGIYIDYTYVDSKLVTIAHQDGRTITLNYTGGLITSAAGTGNKTVNYAYTHDATHNIDTLRTVRNELNETVTYAYDPDGRLNNITDPRGNAAFHAVYDDYNRATSQTFGISSTYTSAFDQVQRETVETTPNGVQITQTFDEEYRLTGWTDSPLGRALRITYATEGPVYGPLTVTDPMSNTTTYRYDDAGNTNMVTDANSGVSRFLYYDDNNLAISLDALGNGTAYVYDENSRLKEIRHDTYANVNTSGELTGGYSYYTNNITSLTYDASGNVSSVKDPDNRVQNITYDTNGLPATVTGASGYYVTNTYDERSRLSSITDGGGPIKSYTYDTSDRASTVTTPAGTVKYTYDANGNIDKFYDANNGHANPSAFTSDYDYDANNNLTRVTDAEGGVTNYTYDTVNNLLTRITLPNGTIKEYEYDDLNRLTKETVTVQSPVAHPAVFDDLNVGSTTVGNDATSTIPICNNGGEAFTIDSVSTNNIDFEAILTAPEVVNPGECYNLTVRFHGTVGAIQTANLTINIAGGGTILVALSAELTLPSLGINATAVSNGISVQWSQFAGSGFDHYSVYRSDNEITDVSALTSIATITNVANTSYVDTTAAYGVKYYYSVVAFNAASEKITLVESTDPVARINLGRLGSYIDVSSSANNEQAVDIAVNTTANNYLMVYQKDISGAGTNYNIYGQLVGNDGHLIGSEFEIMSTTYNEKNPQVVYNSINNEYMVVAEYDSNGSGLYQIREQRVSATGSNTGSTFIVYPTATAQSSPDIAHNFNTANNEYLVVFANDFNGDGKEDLVRIVIEADGAFSSGEYAFNSTAHYRNPRVAYNPANNEYMAVAEKTDDNTYSYRYFIRMDSSGTSISSYTPVDTKKSYKPDLVYNPNFYNPYTNEYGAYATTWEYDVNGDGSKFGVYIHVLSYSLSHQWWTNPEPIKSTLSDMLEPAIEYNDSIDEYLVTYTFKTTSNEYDVRAIRIPASSLVLSNAKTVSVAIESSKIEQESAVVFNSATEEFLVGYEYNNGTDWDVRAQRVGSVASDISVDPLSLDFGTSLTGLNLVVNEITGKGYIYINNSTDQPWLSVSQGGLFWSSSASLSVSVDRSSLALGSYSGNVFVSSSGITTNIPVTMEVTSAAPAAPSGPLPANSATGVAINTTLSWTASDPDAGDVLTYDIYLGTANPPALIASNLVSPSYTPATLDIGATYYWKIVAKDNHGVSTAGPVWSFTTLANVLPVANAGGPYADVEGKMITLDGSGSTDADGIITKYEWDVNNDGTYEYSSSSPTQGHAYSLQGVYTVRLRVTDNGGGFSEATTTATISDGSPVVDFSASPINGVISLTVNFTNASVGLDQPFTYAWDFNNDTIIDSTQQNPSYTYNNVGTYTVKLTVIDSDGSVVALFKTNYINATPASYTVSVDITGSGAVTSLPAGIDCPGHCSKFYAPGTNIILTASPSNGYVFNAWTGCDSTTDNKCTILVDSATTVMAGFVGQSTTVEVSGRQLLVNGQPFTVKGIGYSPVPIGEGLNMPPYGDYFTADFADIYERDLPFLRTMGANAVRLWYWDEMANHIDFLDKAYNNGVDPIYVIAGFWINPDLDIDPASQTNVRESLKANFREMVVIHKDHPAILMWSIGSDLNSTYSGNLNHLFTLINEMAAEAHLEEGVEFHPVTTALADINLIPTISTYNSSVPSLDIWGANIYRGNSFGTLFDDYAAVSSKPLVVLEYGIDAYDSMFYPEGEYESNGDFYHGAYAELLWDEIDANSDICIGGSIMEYSDEWWRGEISTDPACIDSDSSVHSTCGYVDDSQPDGYANDEWWGVMGMVDNGMVDPDIAHTRDIYNRLQSIWTKTSIWTNVGGNNLASNPYNWSGHMLPRDGYNIIFDSTSTANASWDIGINPASLTLSSGYTGTVTLNTALTINGPLMISDGVLNLNGETMTVNGGVIINGIGVLSGSSSDINVSGDFGSFGSGVFNPGTSTVNLTGGDQYIYGYNTFYNLNKTTTTASTLYFDDTSTQTVINELTLEGAPDQLLSLRSTTNNEQFNLVLAPSAPAPTLGYLDVKESDTTGGQLLDGGPNSVSSGNNIDWGFSGATITWTGSTSSVWGTGSNWNFDMIPNSTNLVIIPDVDNNVAHDPILDQSRTIKALTINSGGSLNLNGKDLTVNDNLTVNGTLDASIGTLVITVAGHWDSYAGTFTHGTSEVVLTGQNKTVKTLGSSNSFGANRFYNLTIAGNIESREKFRVQKKLTIRNGAIFTLNSHWTVAVDWGGYLQIEGSGKLAGGTVFYLMVNDNNEDHLKFVNTNGDGAITIGEFIYMVSGTGRVTAADYGNVLQIWAEESNGIGVLGSDLNRNLEVGGNMYVRGAFAGGEKVTLDNTQNNINMDLANALSIGGNANNRRGVFKAGSATINVNRVLINDVTSGEENRIEAGSSTWNIPGIYWKNYGEFDKGTSTVNFTSGAAGNTILSGGAPFQNVAFNSSSGSWILQDGMTAHSLTSNMGGDLVFNAGSTYTITDLTLNGSSGNLVNLSSTNPNNSWNFNVTNITQPLSYVGVSDSNASNQILCTDNCADNGRNTNWIFQCPLVRINGAFSVSFPTLQSAYDAAVDGDVIQSQATMFTGNLNANRSISVNFEPGYDCGFINDTGTTQLN